MNLLKEIIYSGGGSPFSKTTSELDKNVHKDGDVKCTYLTEHTCEASGVSIGGSFSVVRSTLATSLSMDAWLGVRDVLPVRLGLDVRFSTVSEPVPGTTEEETQVVLSVSVELSQGRCTTLRSGSG